MRIHGLQSNLGQISIKAQKSYMGESFRQVMEQHTKMNTTQKELNPVCLRTAIKAYKDEKLTGLTDEDREIIEERINLYLKYNPIKTEADLMLFKLFVRNLKREFGFKGEIDYMLTAHIGSGNRFSINTDVKIQEQTNFPEIKIAN